MSVLFEITLVITLILLNGYFSLSEIALLSVRKSRLRHLAKQGNKKAQAALFLTRKSPEMLSTIQVGISAISIFAGAYGSAALSEHVSILISKIPSLAPYSDPIGIALVIIAITYLSLIIGELVPKQTALSNPESISLIVAKPIKFFMWFSTPIVKILSISTTGVLRLLHIKPSTEQTVTEEEIKLLIAEGTEGGAFEKAEQKMVESIFHLGNRPIKDFITKREEIIWIDINDSMEVIKNKITNSDRSVFPVCSGSLDNSIGAVEAKDVLAHLFDKGVEKIDIKNLVQPIIHINSDVPSLVAIERLKHSAVSIVLIIEKTSQKTIGIVSFRDILEVIVGEFKN